ncbi:MAG: aminodeoxychorismate/anthranilate synthase component II [Opitutales bacterium]|nr:aminodeoxychorismate/anthranilate synthase component II [Opitutales bacterium]
MMLVIDNFDSFTYNLVQYFGQLGVEQKVVRNNEITADEALALNPERILISPGPCSPAQAGNSLAIIDAFKGKAPILGVCLGHQCIGEFFGGKIIRAERIMHGKLSPIHHDGKDLFQDLPQDFQATRYHSLVIAKDTNPECLEVTATSDDDEIMGIRHKELPIWGVQFHPESIAAEHGMQLLRNFINLKAN